MHCKRLFITSICLISTSVFANTWVDELKHQVELTHQQFNGAIERCNNLRLSSPKKIESPWFDTLSWEKKFAAITYLSYMADENCYSPELNAYSAALVNYVAETGERDPLDKLIKARRVYQPTGTKHYFDSIDMSQLKTLAENSELSRPFDPVALSDLYR